MRNLQQQTKFCVTEGTFNLFSDQHGGQQTANHSTLREYFEPFAAVSSLITWTAWVLLCLETVQHELCLQGSGQIVASRIVNFIL